MSFFDEIFQQALAVTQDPEMARLAAAQASLETGYGKHVPGGNLFGIKGPGQALTTHEVVDGKPITTKASFREYDSALESIQDWKRFLEKNPRYEKAGVLSALTAEDKAEALQRAGYATDPQYAAKLQQILSQGPDVRMASIDEEIPRAMQVTGDPRTGLMTMPQTSVPEEQPLIPDLQTLMQMMQPQQPDPAWALLMSGLGILGTPTGTGSPLMGIARGAAQGLGAYQGMMPPPMQPLDMLRAQSQLFELEESRRTRKEKRVQEQKLKSLAESYRQRGMIDKADLIEAGLEREAFAEPKTVEIFDPNIGAKISYERDPVTGELIRLSPETGVPEPPPVLPNLDPDLIQQLQSGTMTTKDVLGVQEQRIERRANREIKFSEDLKKETGGINSVLTSWNSLRDLTMADIERGGKTVDAELIKRYSKMVLPQEAVMSDDMRVIVDANRNFLEQYAAEYAGKGLSKRERLDIMERMNELAQAAQADYDRIRGGYETRLDLYPDLNRERVFFSRPPAFHPSPILEEQQKSDLKAEMRARIKQITIPEQLTAPGGAQNPLLPNQF